MATYPPVPPVPPLGYDPRDQRRFLRDQARAQRAAYRAQREQMRYQMRGYRRGSVLGPIALIAIGILFLLVQTGRVSHDRFWNWYGHWWPLLLVGAGIVVLAEWAFDQFHLRDPQHPPYRRTIGGGVVLLLVLLGFAGFAADHSILNHLNGEPRLPGFGFDQDSLDELLGDKRESDQNVDAEFPAGNSLNVVNPRGDVTITGISDDGRIHIAVHKQIFSRSDSDADSRAQQMSPEISNDLFGMSVKMPVLDGARADLTITVPAAAATTVNAGRGDIHVASIKAPVSVTANHGDIELSAITGATTAHINNSGSSITAHNLDGGITIQGRAQDITLSDVTGSVSLSGDFFDTTHFEHINGPIHFHTRRADFQLARLDGEAEVVRDNDISASQALGPLILTSPNGNVTLDRIAGDIAVTSTNGSIDLTAAPTLGNITLQDRNGAIRLTVPEHAAFSVQAETRNGNIESGLQLSPWNSGNGKTLNGSVGMGGPLVHITSTNGDISIHKADVQPLAPTPPAPPKITQAPVGPSVSAQPATHSKKHQVAADTASTP